MALTPVTLQINLAPRDFRFARYLFPRIESGDIPDGQRGYHDMNASMRD